nr:hypothetical protein [Micromonospora sp. DSM 115978]
MTKLLTIADLAFREMVRRRAVLVIMLLVPLLFYLARRSDHTGQSIRFLCLGLGWALSTAALFAGSAARGLDPRLRLSGYRAYHLHLGRLLALWSLGLLLCAPYFLLVRFDQDDVRYGAVALILLLTVATAAPLGLALSAVLPRDLEGTLVLLLIIGLQMIMDPADPVTRLLPFWFSREIGTYAVDHTAADYLARGLTHGVVVTVALTALVALATGIRLRQRSHLRFTTTA